MADMTPEHARAILGLSSDCTAQTIRSARRQLVRAHHPDLVPRHLRAQSDRKLAEINTAFDLLIALKGTRNAATDRRENGEASAPSDVVFAARARHNAHTAAPKSGPAPAPETAASRPRPTERTTEPQIGQQTASDSNNARPAPVPSLPTQAPRRQAAVDRRARDAFEAGLRAISRAPGQSLRTEYA